MVDFNLPNEWKNKLQPTFQESWFVELTQFLDKEANEKKSVYPPAKDRFRAIRDLDFSKVKVVILGQDPYHGAGQAMGLSFAVPNDCKPKPPSLQNIFKELKSDLGIEINPDHSDLTGWVQQGVLLLNTVLTVRAGEPLSHRNQGWEKFSDRVMTLLGNRADPMVFILWGSHAQKFKEKINLVVHAVIESPHPSPLSSYRGFFGSKPFSKTNAYLKQWDKEEIDWGKISGLNTHPPTL